MSSSIEIIFSLVYTNHPSVWHCTVDVDGIVRLRRGFGARKLFVSGIDKYFMKLRMEIFCSGRKKSDVRFWNLENQKQWPKYRNLLSIICSTHCFLYKIVQSHNFLLFLSSSLYNQLTNLFQFCRNNSWWTTNFKCSWWSVFVIAGLPLAQI
jgi:hypothetical protein